MEQLFQVDTQKTINLLRALRCGQNLSKSALEVLSGVGIKKSIPKGKKIWSMGDPADFVAVVLSGAVEVTKITSDGAEKCLGLFGRSDAIGISAVIRKIEYPATAKSIASSTEVIKLYIRPILQGKNEPWFDEVSIWLRELLLSHEQVLRDKIDILSAGRVELRLLELVKQMISRFGIRKSRADYLIPFAISKTQIAKITEVRTETVIRTLSQWQKMKLIEFRDEGIYVPDWDILCKRLSIDEYSL